MKDFAEWPITKLLLAGLAVLLLALAGLGGMLSWRHYSNRVIHQLPHKWDSYVRPDLHFTSEPLINVIASINEAIREASHGELPEAIKLDCTPTQIVKVAATPELDGCMEELIAAFRQHEQELNRLGAMGFENAPFTGSIPGRHSLWCFLVMGGAGGLHWEVKADALYVYRYPRIMELRPYYVSERLLERAEQEQRVDADPVVSALITQTEIHSWSVMVPESDVGWKSEARYDKVFKYIPDLNVILAIAEPEEHAQAQQRLKHSGLWAEPAHDALSEGAP